MKSFQPVPPPSDQRTRAPFPTRWPGWRVFFKTFHLRDCWWLWLDCLESYPVFRRVVYTLAVSAVLLGAVAWWGYPQWNRYRTIQQARQWLASGHYRYALDAAKDAMIAAPESPEPWQITAELARLGGQNHKALDYARRAAELAPDDADVLINWAAAALRADQAPEANRALALVAADQQTGSPHVQRLRGELARRAQDLTEAQTRFQAAIRLEGPLAVNEVPLGLVLLNATDPALRERGLSLLRKWTADRDWGATALRLLLADAQSRADPAASYQWAEALRTHPACTVSDMPNCLLALAQTNPRRFAEVLAELEKDHAVSPKAAAQLLSWLNQIGRGREALTWMKTLPPDALRRPPLVVAAAEALRLAGEWAELAAWSRQNEWGRDLEFLRWSYGLLAAQNQHETRTVEELRSTLLSHAQRNSIHAHFAAATLYSWGLTADAEALWWRAAEHNAEVAIDALGSLARHYQVQRDAEGQYRAFKQLHLLRPHDADIGNNLAFFAALTGREQRTADQISRANLAAQPRNPLYAATRAFVLVTQNEPQQALAVLAAFSAADRQSPGMAFAYGLALAGSAQRSEARAILTQLPPESLTWREVALIRSTLAN